MEEVSSVYIDKRFYLVCQKFKMKKYVSSNYEENKYLGIK